MFLSYSFHFPFIFCPLFAIVLSFLSVLFPVLYCPFMLFHFSLKYKDEEIKEIMEVEFEKERINNVELWLSDL